jgi:hypothetical protein
MLMIDKKAIFLGFTLIAMTALVGPSNAAVSELYSQTELSSSSDGTDFPLKDDYYTQTQAVAEALTTGSFESFAGVIPDGKTGIVHLFVTATPDLKLEEYLGVVQGVELLIHTSEYSHIELEAGIKMISKEILRSVKDGIDVYSAHARDDGSSIELTLRPHSSSPSSDWLENLTKIAGVKVTVKEKAGEVPDSLFTLQTRTTPTAPWWGGSLFVAGGMGCSTGFGVTSDVTNLDYMMTARHCFGSSSNLSINSYGSNSYMGSWSPSQYYNFPDYDTALTFPSGQEVSNKVFTGAHNSNSNSGKTISGVGSNTLNRLVCVNGANSGAHCSVKVIQTPSTVYSNGQAISGLVTGKRDNNTIVGAHGDSGGPVVGQYSSSAFVFGYGIVHGGLEIGQCSNLNTSVNIPGSICGTTINWIDLATALAATHMSLK